MEIDIDILRKEAERIRADADFTGRGHLNEALVWKLRHNTIGIATVIFAGAASAQILTDQTILNLQLGSLCGAIAAILAAISTFLSPGSVAKDHSSLGNQYLSLRNEARFFCDVACARPNTSCLYETLQALSAKRNLLNEGPFDVSRASYKKAKADIEAGMSTHKGDEAKT